MGKRYKPKNTKNKTILKWPMPRNYTKKTTRFEMTQSHAVAANN